MLRKLPVNTYVSVPPPPTPWVVYPMIASRGSLSLISAKPGNGKSWLSLGACKALTMGQRVAGMSNGGKPHKIVYIDAENGEGVLRRRLYKIGCNPDLFSIRAAEGFTLNNLDDLYDCLATENWPSLVVLDSFRSLFRGDENDPDLITHVLDGVKDVLEQRNCAGILLHHDSKHGGYRGTGAFAGSCDVVIQMSALDDCVYSRILRWEKCRLDETPDSFRFNLREITGNDKPCNCNACLSFDQ